jgi:hypothetical protein
MPKLPFSPPLIYCLCSCLRPTVVPWCSTTAERPLPESWPSPPSTFAGMDSSSTSPHPSLCPAIVSWLLLCKGAAPRLFLGMDALLCADRTLLPLLSASSQPSPPLAGYNRLAASCSLPKCTAAALHPKGRVLKPVDTLLDVYKLRSLFSFTCSYIDTWPIYNRHMFSHLLHDLSMYIIYIYLCMCRAFATGLPLLSLWMHATPCRVVFCGCVAVLCGLFV